MGNEEPIQLEGTIGTVLPGTMFRVKLDNQHEVLAHLSGKMRKHFVRLTVGDRVRLEMSPYDLKMIELRLRLGTYFCTDPRMPLSPARQRSFSWGVPTEMRIHSGN